MPSGHPVMTFTADGRGIFLTAPGASERGNYPFLDVMDVATGQSRRLWRAEDPYYETVVTVLDDDGSRILTRRESDDRGAQLLRAHAPRRRRRAR